MIRWNSLISGASAVGLDDRDDDIINAVQVRREVTVMRDGVEALPGGILYTAPELSGIVDKKVVLRIPPEGPGETVEAYYQNKFLALLQKQGSHGLSDALHAARLGRAADLQAIAGQLKEVGKQLLTGRPQLPVIEAPEVPKPTESPSQDNTPPTSRTKDSVPDLAEEES
jgi:hypothetical protein